MIFQKWSKIFLALATVVLLTTKTSAAIIVMVNATTSFAYTTNAGVFTVTRTGDSTAVTVKLAVSGTAVYGMDYPAFPTNITMGSGVFSTNLSVRLTNSIAAAKTVVLSLLTNASYFTGLSTNAVVTLLPSSSVTNSVSLPTGRYWRGSGGDPSYWSQVVPLDYEKGVVYSNLNGNAASLYQISSWSSTTLYHYNATNPLSQNIVSNRIAFNNPIVAFGERVGGTPLYLNQPYSFGIAAGMGMSATPSPPITVGAIRIDVFYQTNFGYAGVIFMYPPQFPFNSDTNRWQRYITNGFQIATSTNYAYTGSAFQLTTNNFGLRNIFSATPNLKWGASANPGYVMTHTANNQATNFYYMVQEYSSVDTNWMVLDGSGFTSPSFLYTMEFEQRPAWRSVFLDQPHFDGSPLPPFYAGKTVAEILTNTPPVTNIVNFTPSAATNLDNSPELRRHPILDNFVACMGNDPIALANYVVNEIGLTDPMDYSDNGNVAEQSINPTGVTRGALGAFLEKQGSPVEQCALLVYLLRQAGVPAVYEFAPRNGIQILDARLSRMLKFQVHGGFTEAGKLYTTNTMIGVNYPWVAAYIGTNWVHIFPWLKDYEISEGFDLYDMMPTNYSNAYGWLKDYIYASTNLLNLAVDGNNTPSVIFPRFLQQTLQQNHPGISVDDIGVKILNRRHNYARWQDFPTPTWITNVSRSIENLTSSAITNISPTLTNIFDTVSVEIYSLADPTKDIQTGDMRLCDLHNREFYIYQYVTNSTQVQLNLILLPFRSSITNQFSFGNDTNLLSRQALSLTLASSDDQLGFRFHYHRHRALSAAYAIDPTLSFLGFSAGEKIDLERPLRKGDQAAICLNYGQVTHDMLNVHAADIWQMENGLRTNSALTNSVSPDVYMGALMYLAGMSYYEKVSSFDQVNQHLHKMDILSTWSAGLSRISPARNGTGGLLNGKIDPVLPCVDMFFYLVAGTGNSTVQPDSGQTEEMAQQNYNLIALLDKSAQEHQVINRFYKQTNAVSTVRLLQMAQSQGLGIVPLNIFNYVSQGTTLYQGHQLRTYDTNMWQDVTNFLKVLSPNGSGNNIAYMTPGPINNSSYSGMAALKIG
ncbi:MAG TPA: transglutaminase domain-containing protein, partial [Verrucomicrobiae bacterium]|nr:transglutaminase domain-containing protein [Verrucomicrobiae bacterium]